MARRKNHTTAWFPEAYGRNDGGIASAPERLASFASRVPVPVSAPAFVLRKTFRRKNITQVLRTYYTYSYLPMLLSALPSPGNRITCSAHPIVCTKRSPVFHADSVLPALHELCMLLPRRLGFCHARKIMKGEGRGKMLWGRCSVRGKKERDDEPACSSNRQKQGLSRSQRFCGGDNGGGVCRSARLAGSCWFPPLLLGPCCG